MLVDEVVVAGSAVAGLIFVFTGGIGYFIWKDARKYK
ncbi:cytochrome c oxidase subunit CcoM [Azotobacter vinelandii]|nr:cytochrome c oxidase subunit CcoM [Azotobacter vinelandii]WKN20155.1 ATP-dependent helicase [Azotobacter vinelandii]